MSPDQPSELSASPPALVGELQAVERTVVLDVSCREVYTLFSTNPGIPGVVVVQADGTLAGLMSRQRFMEVFSRPYRSEVYFGRTFGALAAGGVSCAHVCVCRRYD